MGPAKSTTHRENGWLHVIRSRGKLPIIGCAIIGFCLKHVMHLCTTFCAILRAPKGQYRCRMEPRGPVDHYVINLHVHSGTITAYTYCHGEVQLGVTEIYLIQSHLPIVLPRVIGLSRHKRVLIVPAHYCQLLAPYLI